MSGSIITVAQQKGGSGKTTLSAQMPSPGRSRRGGPSPFSTWIRRAAWASGWSSASAGWARPRRASPSAPPAVGGRGASRALARDYDIVIVDTPPHADLDLRNAMELAALVLVPLQPTPADLWATEATLALAEKERVPALMVLNRVPPRARLTDDIARKLADFEAPLAAGRFGNRVIFAESLGAGSTALEMRPASPAAEEVRALAGELLKSAGAA